MRCHPVCNFLFIFVNLYTLCSTFTKVSSKKSVSPILLHTSEEPFLNKKMKNVKLVKQNVVEPSLRCSRGGNVDNSNVNAKISNFRDTIFPIYGKDEITKFLILCGINFFIIIALTLTRDLKDTMVVTKCGAEAIAFLKIYGVLPCAGIFITCYSKLSSILGKKCLFYTCCIPFFIFFVLFDTIIYPNAGTIQPSLKYAQSLVGANTIANILANWTAALYYVIAEIYSSVSVGLLFWQHANDVVPIHQAKRFYPLFAQSSAFAPIFAGQYVVRYASKASNFASSLRRITGAVTISGILACLFYALSNLHSGKEKVVPNIPKQKKMKQTMSLMESAKFLASSQYLRMIAILVVGYGLSINFTEILWKSLLKKKYSNPLEYQGFIGNFSSAVGCCTMIVTFIGVHVIRIFGWKVGALATPSIMALLGLPFFTLLILGLDSPNRLNAIIWIGTIQNLLSKTGKYALFDSTTQMSYIPLDDESKIKGKAAIDVLGSRLGKSGGSFIQQGLVLFFGNIVNAAPVVAFLFYSVLACWIIAANKLNVLFLEKTSIVEQKKKKE